MRTPRAVRAETVAASLVPALVILALAELLFLRTLTRVAIHIPAGAPIETPYLLAAGAGRIAYSAAALLAFLIAAAGAVALATRPSPPARVAGVLVAGFLALALLTPFATGLRTFLDAATGLASIGVAAALVALLGPHRSIPFVLLACSSLAASFAAVIQAEPALPRGALPSFFTATELLALAFALSAPLAVGLPISLRVGAAGALGAALAAATLLAPTSSGRIMLLWNGGLDGSLPVPAYILASGALFAALAAAHIHRQSSMLLALLLVCAAGIGLHNSYQSLLFLVALLVPALPTTADAPHPSAAAAELAPPSPQPASRPSIGTWPGSSPSSSG